MTSLNLVSQYVKSGVILSLYEDVNNHDYMYIFKDFDSVPVKIPEWQYNIDDIDFFYLEQGYEIFNMPLETHKDFWNYINIYFDDMNHIDGMQKYFDYCLIHDITSELLEEMFAEEVPDIFEYKYSSKEIYESKTR